MKNKYNNKLRAISLLKLQVEKKELATGEREKEKEYLRNSKKTISTEEEANRKRTFQERGCDERLNVSE